MDSSEEHSDSQRGSSVKYMQWNCDITADEEDLIIRLHKLLGDRWALIAGRLPWRRAEDIENFWKNRSHGYVRSSD